MWDFFMDDHHRLHGARIAGLLYIVSLAPGCFDGLSSPMCLARISFTAGWWLAFCDKQPARSISQFFSGRHAVGVITIAVSLVAQFYFLGKK
jgi:hypothetical protein